MAPLMRSEPSASSVFETALQAFDFEIAFPQKNFNKLFVFSLVFLFSFFNLCMYVRILYVAHN